MNKTSIKNIYDVSQSQRKQICLKVCLTYDMKFLSHLKLIYEDKKEIVNALPENNLNYQAISEKLYCYSCNQNFQDYHEMRKHQWTRTHQIKSGLITSNSDSFIDDVNDDSSDNDKQIETLSEEEVEVDADFEEDQESDEEHTNITVEATEDKLDNFTNLDYINALKSGEIPFCEMSSFPTMYFQNASNEIIGIKRCILFNKKSKPENGSELMKCVTTLLECKKFAVFLYSGGSFAGAIFNGHQQVLHKTIKRYTCRRKQGGSQTTKDNQGQACKSGGAYLRRVNTQKLLDDVFQLLHCTWSSEIASCGLILVWSAKSQRHVFGNKSQLNQTRTKLSFDLNSDSRVRFISARLSKVNNSTLIDVYQQVSTIEVYDVDTVASFTAKNKINSICEPLPPKENLTTVVDSKSVKYKSDKCVTKEIKISDKVLSKETTKIIDNFKNLDTLVDSKVAISSTVVDNKSKEDEIRTKLLNYVLNDSAEDLVPYINELKLSKSSDDISYLLSIPLKTKNQSLLHLAISHNNINVIGYLLQFGCDPLHRNINDETPYAQAIREGKKMACTVMSEYMFKNPIQYDYHAAKFPGGKDPLKEEKRRKIAAEKKKQSKNDRKQRKKEEDEERRKEAIKKCQCDQFLALTNADKIAHIKQMERDQRKRFLLCFQCAMDISDVVPFSYSDFSFCGMDCLKKHRLTNVK